MELLTDPAPELTLLAEEIAAVAVTGKDPVAPPPHRAILIASRAIGEILDRASAETSDEERAFAVRGLAVRSVAEILVALTAKEGELQLMYEDLARALVSISPSSLKSSAALTEPRYEPGAAALIACSDLGSAAAVLLAGPAASRLAHAGLLEDMLNACTSLLTLAWRLRAWAASA